LASSVSLGVPAFVDAAADSAQTPFRQFDVGSRVIQAGTASANAVGGGVFPGGGAMAVSAGSGMAVVCAAGLCCVPNSTSALQGGYITGTMTSAALTLAAADPSNYRIDLVCVTVNDLGTASSNAEVQVVTGTPASSPSAPSLPANSISLAQVLVAPGSSSVTTGSITDERAYVVAPGGVLPIASSSAAPAAPAWQLMYDLATNAVVQGTGTAGTTAPLTLLPWSPVVSVATTNVSDVAAKGVLTTIATASITTDGSTDIEIYYKATGWKASGSVPLLVTMQVSLDSTVLDQCVISVPSTSVFGAGGSARFYTSAAQSNTPGAGSHTITFAFQSASTSVTTTLSAAASAPAMLRVAPVS
jgi:hypothetical protein